MPKLTAKQLNNSLDYDPVTGIFTRKGTCTVAGSLTKKGYVRIMVGGTPYMAHRLAWLHTYGEWPSRTLDHVNRVGNDNRIANLRLATRSENSGNAPCRKTNKLGVRGVYWHPAVNKFAAQLQVNNKKAHLGYFTTVEEAKAAYDAAAKEHFKEFFHSGEGK